MTESDDLPDNIKQAILRVMAAPDQPQFRQQLSDQISMAGVDPTDDLLDGITEGMVNGSIRPADFRTG